ncbi:DUF742 domain-containing protein [Kitasatospora xanthocidica]|uniref:DUF742 domain-containing protein n=1 Tax=Kitasatospora xanthocidica TaxID=83382 RepID=A0A373A141_9ACTN|nr:MULTISPECIES: DUF742 domain-containing protein [Streptomycetaceae]OKI08501.1 hypothetical protein AMK13_08280 [Streptomyces sp. CB02056]RGD61781.1 DUF742 domain-containing protein [Kitasatospora xanthocidica]
MTAVPRRRMVPAYLATGGRSRPGTKGFERLTVLFADRADPPEALDPEHRRLWELLRPGALTVVEAAAHLSLPVSATVFLAADLVEAGCLHARAPIPRAQQTDRSIVERLLVGLRALR